MTLDCRKAQMGDAELLWRWANDPDTRRNAFSTAPIPYAEHLAWLEGRLRSEATSIWIFSHGPAPVGQVRFDLTGDVAEISIVVAPEQRGRGYGKAMLPEAVRRLREERGEAVRPRALVLKQNARSLKLFEACGFREVDVVERAGGKQAVVLELVGGKERAGKGMSFTGEGWQP